MAPPPLSLQTPCPEHWAVLPSAVGQPWKQSLPAGPGETRLAGAEGCTEEAILARTHSLQPHVAVVVCELLDVAFAMTAAHSTICGVAWAPEWSNAVSTLLVSTGAHTLCRSCN